MNVFDISVHTSQLSILIPIIAFLAKKSNFKNQNLRVPAILLAVSAVSDLTGFIIVRVYNLSNLPVNNIFFLCQFLLLSWMYWRFYESAERQFLRIGIIIFVNVFIVNTLFGQGLFVLQTITNSVSSLIIGIMSMRFFKHLHHLPVSIKGKDATFRSLYFINSGIFAYFSLNFWLFTISPAMMELFNEQGTVNLWAFHNAANILKNLLFAVGIYWAGVKE